MTTHTIDLNDRTSEVQSNGAVVAPNPNPNPPTSLDQTRGCPIHPQRGPILCVVRVLLIAAPPRASIPCDYSGEAN